MQDNRIVIWLDYDEEENNFKGASIDPGENNP
mgnify:CR=1 FL=1